jgi:hypothetical protein
MTDSTEVPVKSQGWRTSLSYSPAALTRIKPILQ